MKKFKLKTEISYDFKLIGISSHEKPHKLTWAINTKLNFSFIQSENIILFDKKLNEEFEFAKYTYIDDNEVEYNLISNRSSNAFFLNELSNFDYFLQLYGDLSKQHRDEIISNLRTVEFINAALKLDPICLLQRDRFLF